MSIISRNPGMDTLVTEVFSMYRVKDATGAIVFGMDTGKWPARWYDAVRLAEAEDAKVEEARDKRKGGGGV